jgi:hypothetical protein
MRKKFLRQVLLLFLQAGITPPARADAKLHKMKTLYFKKTMILFLLIGIVFACVHDEQFDNNYSLTVEDAHQWYEANKGNAGFELRSGKKDMITLQPKWDRTSSKKNDTYEVVDAAITSDLVFNFSDKACKEKFKETGDARYLLSKSQLVVRKNKKTGETEGFLMTIIPSLSYLESTHFDPFKKNSYVDRDKKLSGYVIYHDMEGRLVNGWKYEDGKAYAIPLVEEDETGIQLRYGCSMPVVVDADVWQCSVFAEWESGLLTEIGIQCGWNHTFVVFTYCDDDFGGGTVGPPGNGDYGGPGAGGGGGPANPSNNTPEQRTDCPPEAAANSATTNNVLNSTYGVESQVKSNVDIIKNYALNSSNSKEYGLSVDKTNGQYSVHNQGNGVYIKEGTSSGVSVGYNSNAYLLVHNHTSGGYSAPSPGDAISLAHAYKSSATNIQGSVIYCSNGSSYVIYVNDRSTLGDFCNNSQNNNFFEPNGANFKTNSIFDEYYGIAKTNMLNQGYSQNDALSYALSYVLDYFRTGLKISKKESGKNDFKEQKTELSTIGAKSKYTPKICP